MFTFLTPVDGKVVTIWDGLVLPLNELTHLYSVTVNPVETKYDTLWIKIIKLNQIKLN